MNIIITTLDIIHLLVFYLEHDCDRRQRLALSIGTI
jgi:hypothetical protein